MLDLFLIAIIKKKKNAVKYVDIQKSLAQVSKWQEKLTFSLEA